MRNSLKDFKARALARPDVRREYEGLKEEFELLDEILKGPRRDSLRLSSRPESELLNPQ